MAVLFILGVCSSQAQTEPKLIDSHIHVRGEPGFLERYTAKVEAANAMAVLLVQPNALDEVKKHMAKHPNRFFGFGELKVDDPDVLNQVDRFHAAGFRGLGEFQDPDKPFDDPKYWPVYARAEKYGMMLLFHTGIVDRQNPTVPSNNTSARQNVSNLDLIARKFPGIWVIGAHMGNPDYAWAGELARWNPNVYFDLTGSSLIKKREDYTYFNSIFWWTRLVNPHTPKSGLDAWEKLIFGSDVDSRAGEIEEFDRELERYHALLDACHVSAQVQAKIFAGTMWRLLHSSPKDQVRVAQ